MQSTASCSRWCSVSGEGGGSRTWGGRPRASSPHSLPPERAAGDKDALTSTEDNKIGEILHQANKLVDQGAHAHGNELQAWLHALA